MAIGCGFDGARHARALFALGPVGDLSDGQLLERFARRDGDRAEMAFAALVERHGPMVLRTCRAVLRDGHDAHDAFQATFLVLARKAGSLRVGESLAAWLHQVARRTALCDRSASLRRRDHERRAAERNPTVIPAPAPDDLGEALHAEIDRLPDRFRAAVVLCLLEGHTHDQAARHLGWPVGTLQSRLARGRDRLRSRLARRGLAPAPAVAPAVVLVPPSLIDLTARAATGLAAGDLAAGMVPASVLTLSREAIRVMFVSKLKLAGATVLGAGLCVSGAGVLAQQGDARPSPTPAPAAAPRPEVEKQIQEVGLNPAQASAAAVVSDERLELQIPTAETRMTITIEVPKPEGGIYRQQLIPKLGEDGHLHVSHEQTNGQLTARSEIVCSSIEIKPLADMLRKRALNTARQKGEDATREPEPAKIGADVGSRGTGTDVAEPAPAEGRHRISAPTRSPARARTPQRVMDGDGDGPPPARSSDAPPDDLGERVGVRAINPDRELATERRLDDLERKLDRILDRLGDLPATPRR